ncbi:MAG: hypothetical protein HY078_14705 [Elusimicrobia bacterium]|nr:hypothetical protein [Elusimicrobiota bacterium]
MSGNATRKARRTVLLGILSLGLGASARAQAPALFMSPALMAGALRPAIIGIEAIGVAPEVALRYAGRLDVRDALGRQVSARLIERQVGAGIKAMEAQGEAARPPAVRRLLRLLEALVHHAKSLRRSQAPSACSREVAAPRGSRTSWRAAASAAAAIAVPSLKSLLPVVCAAWPRDPSFQRSAILRC